MRILDALLKTLNALKNNYGDNISIVFGCGVTEIKKKRPLMARIANNFCRKIYITDDNPRDEEPKKIEMKDIYLRIKFLILEIERWLLTKQFKTQIFKK